MLSIVAVIAKGNSAVEHPHHALRQVDDYLQRRVVGLHGKLILLRRHQRSRKRGRPAVHGQVTGLVRCYLALQDGPLEADPIA